MSHFALMRDGITDATEHYVENLGIAFVNSTGGVVGLLDYLVASQSDATFSPIGSDNTNVKINKGRAYTPTSDGSMMYPSYLDTAVINVAISSNSSGVNRMDTIVLYVDLAATPNPDGTGVMKFFDVLGPTDGSNVPPTGSAILTAISNNPYIKLANVECVNGFTSINSGNITDIRETATLTIGKKIPVATFEEFTDQISVPTTPASGFSRLYAIGGVLFHLDPNGIPVQVSQNAVVANGLSGNATTIDWSQGLLQTLTVKPVSGSNVTLTFSNPVSGEHTFLGLLQGVGGSFTVTWPGTVKWPSATPPTLTVTAGQTDWFEFIVVGANYFGQTYGQDY